VSGSGPPAAAWFARAYHELLRDRHVLLHGNVNDLVSWDDSYYPLPAAISSFLSVTGFQAIARYNLIDGLSYVDDESRKFLEAQLANAAMPNDSQGNSAPVEDRQTSEVRASESNSRQERLSASARQLQQRMNAARNPAVRTVNDLLGAARPMLAQRERACAIVIDQADLIFGSPGSADDHYQRNLAQLSKLFADAGHAPSRHPGEMLRNTVVLVMGQLSMLPNWAYRENPHTAPVAVTHPGFVERSAFISSSMDRFCGGTELSPDEVASTSGALANLTEGMTILDIRALAATSRLTKILPTSPRRLVMRHRFGLREDPWERLDIAKVQAAEDLLSRRVIGQGHAVRTVADVLVNARIGLDFQSESDQAATRPKGVFFFVGPTGVGKTELAKAIAELVFDDENSLRRFDMSEFGQEHTSERLTGAPPGYIGHESGGVLTNWMIERPFSVVLFDEIEKAHPKIFDKFLQVIDDGRLTDGQGRTAFFSHSVVIFTSNLGASGLKGLLDGFGAASPGYNLIAQHFEQAVRNYFAVELGRPELLGRLGSGIVAFDILRDEVIARIVSKFLDQLAAASAARGYQLVFDRKAIEQAVTSRLAESGASLGAREIRNPLLDQWVRVPLNRWILNNTPPSGTRIWIHRSTSSPPFVVETFPTAEEVR
jgi:hypothetical protein